MKDKERLTNIRKVGRATKSVGHMTKTVGDAGLSGLFASRTLARLVTTFFIHADKDYYQKELVDKTGAGLYTVQRELARLEKTGLVTRMPRGNRVYYRTNGKHPAFEDLKRVILKTMGLGEALRSALAPLTGRVRLAFIYGSFARGEETPESDVDVLFVGDLALRDVSAILGPISRKLGREFNPTVYPPDEFRAKAKEGQHFVARILKSKKIYLIGDGHELKRIVG